MAKPRLLTDKLDCRCTHGGKLEIASPPIKVKKVRGPRVLTLEAFKSGTIIGCPNPPISGGPCEKVRRAVDPISSAVENDGKQVVTEMVQALTDKGVPLVVFDPGNALVRLNAKAQAPVGGTGIGVGVGLGTAEERDEAFTKEDGKESTAPVFLLVAIDGTDSQKNLNADGSNSHVYMFWKDFETPSTQKRYISGPTLSGRDVRKKQQEAVDWLRGTLSRYQSVNVCVPDSRVRVCLVGHSRGGLIAIEVARELASIDVPVEFLGLYDAVDMAPVSVDESAPIWSMLSFPSGDIIDNVRVTYHALRDPTLDYGFPLGRSWWGNTGLEPRASGGMYIPQKFFTSHGGIGGAPDLKPEWYQDAACDTRTLSADIMKALGVDLGTACMENSTAADTWMRKRARERGLPIGPRSVKQPFGRGGK